MQAERANARAVNPELFLVRRLLVLCRQYGDGGTQVLLPLTQSELAEMAGATRPTVNKVLRTLEAARVLALRRGSVHVLDRAARRAHAE